MVIAGTILLIIGITLTCISIAEGGYVAAYAIAVVSTYLTIPGIVFLSIGKKIERNRERKKLIQNGTETQQKPPKEFYLVCPVCGYQVFEDYKCCPHCETKLEFEKVSSKYCTNCGKELDEEHKFCPYCGKEKY